VVDLVAMLQGMDTSSTVPDRFRQQGWQRQFARAERWRERAVDALRNGDPDAEDFLYAFCQAAYHMRDWLLNSGAADRQSLQDLMTRTSALKVCRDVCNGSKHFALDPRMTSTARIALMREYVAGPGSGDRLRLIAVVGHDGSVNCCEITALLDECLAAWRDFCRSFDST
jgi:hypothetical protein